MKTKVKQSIIGIVILIALALGAKTVSSLTAESSEPVVEPNTITVTISATAGEEVLSVSEYETEEGTILLDLMMSEMELDVSEEGFISAIEGVTQDAENNEWWVFDLNGEMGIEPADVYELQDGDHIEWILMAF